ncbi:MAG: hypothetical protein KJN76_07860, partial [Eudoraea sp.]|nr:hypothetical protein [Eudoraea sp.]
MNKLQRIVFKLGCICFCLMAFTAYGQKETKTYKESFKVADDAVIDINTSHADIEFQTWDKNEVVIEAKIELEGATREEAEAYYEKGGIKIMGNSKSIEIRTQAESSFSFHNGSGDILVNDFIIDIPEFPELEPLFLDLEIPDLPDFPEIMEMPPMPPISMNNFDYERYRKEGDKYMKEWKKEFDKNFDEEYKSSMAEWAERMEERTKAWKERQEERKQLQKERMQERQLRLEERKEQLQDRQKELAERQRERAEEMREREKALLLARKAIDSTRFLFIDRDSLHNRPNFFFNYSHGEHKKYKVKKTIKIKMPKSAKLKMNVRHGEVKLAENTMNLNATLSYARLLAYTIDGERTNIVASYSPVSVQSWENGSLNTNFSDKISLKDVRTLKLSSNSSDVTIERLLNSAYIKNNLGALRINDLDKSFRDLDISIQHGELKCELPLSPYTIYVQGSHSKFTSPPALVWDKTVNTTNFIHQGYHLNKDAESSIIIYSVYSDV